MPLLRPGDNLNDALPLLLSIPPPLPKLGNWDAAGAAAAPRTDSISAKRSLRLLSIRRAMLIDSSRWVG